MRTAKKILLGLLGDLGGAGGSPGGSPYTLNADAGSFVLTGDDMIPLVDRTIPADVAAFTLTGVDVAFDYTPSSAPFSLTATANAVDTTAQTTYSFASQSFGTADSTRVIAVLIGARNAGGTQIVSSASFGGVAASKAVGQLAGSSADVSEIWYAAVPTGTTGTVSITFAGANSRCSIQVYSIIAPSSAAPTATGSSTANAGTTTITIPAGGAAIGGSYTQAGGPGTPTATPAGFNNLDLNNNINGTQQTFAFHSNAGVITGSQTLTMTLAGASAVASTFAAWGP